MVIDDDTGEVIGDKFAKLFFSDIEKLFGITGTQKDLLMCMVRDCKYGNLISLTTKRKKSYASEVGYSSVQALNNALRFMSDAEVIKQEEEGSTQYLLNPEIVFKGNDYQHAEVIIKYSRGTREISVVNGALANE